MEPGQHLLLVTLVASVTGMAIFFFFSWKPVADRLKRLAPDPEKGFKTVFLASMGLYVVAVFVMIIAVALHMLGIIG